MSLCCLPEVVINLNHYQESIIGLSSRCHQDILSQFQNLEDEALMDIYYLSVKARFCCKILYITMFLCNLPLWDLHFGVRGWLGSVLDREETLISVGL